MLFSLMGLTMLAGSHALPLAAPQPCVVMEDHVRLAGRQSPLDSVAVMVGGKEIKVCYGRPSLRGRTMLGGAAVPYGKLWRTGSNEPTMIHTEAPLTIAGIKVPAGSYALYTVPGASEWEIIVNRSITQWGHESTYTRAVESQEVGRGVVKAEALTSPVETFTIRMPAPTGPRASIVLEWQKARVVIPVEVTR